MLTAAINQIAALELLLIKQQPIIMLMPYTIKVITTSTIFVSTDFILLKSVPLIKPTH